MLSTTQPFTLNLKTGKFKYLKYMQTKFQLIWSSQKINKNIEYYNSHVTFSRNNNSSVEILTCATPYNATHISDNYVLFTGNYTKLFCLFLIVPIKLHIFIVFLNN